MNKQEVIQYLGKNKMDVANANAVVIAADLVFQAYADSDIVHGVNFSPILSYFGQKSRNDLYQIIREDILRSMGRKVYLDFLKSEKTSFQTIKEQKELEKSIDKLGQEYLKNRGEMSNDQLFDYFQKFSKVTQNWWHYGAIGEDKGQFINHEIIPEFSKRHNLDLSKANEIINTLSHPQDQSVLSLERPRFLDICLSVLDNSLDYSNRKVKKKIDKYIDDYFWYETDFCRAKEITPQSLLKRVEKEIGESSKEKIEKEIQDIQGSFKKIEKDRKELLSQLKLTKQDKKDILFSQVTVEWVDDRKEAMMKSFYYFFTFINDIAKKHNLEYKYLSLYTIEEFNDFLSKGEKINEQEIERRQDKAFVVWEKEKDVTFFYNQDAQELFETVIKIDSEEIKGQVASTGGVETIQGRVRIVHNPNKDVFNDGEVLVTSMTRVEYVPLMRKAKAIITNEGGIACHASIVSRELNIPCVIGTKIADKILKDGDKVEINLEKGTVKIIK